MNRILRLAAALAAVAASHAAHGAIVRLDLVAQVSSYSYDSSYYATDPFGLGPGDTITGSTYFSTTAQNLSSDPAVGQYDMFNFCVSGMVCPPPIPPTSVRVSGQLVTPEYATHVTVNDSPAGAGSDRVSIYSWPTVGGPGVVQVTFVDDSGTALDSTAVPYPFPALDRFTAATIEISNTASILSPTTASGVLLGPQTVSYYDIKGSITAVGATVVPSPSSIYLFMVGLGGLAVLRSRRY